MRRRDHVAHITLQNPIQHVPDRLNVETSIYHTTGKETRRTCRETQYGIDKRQEEHSVIQYLFEARETGGRRLKAREMQNTILILQRFG